MCPASGASGGRVQGLLVQPMVMDAHVRDLRYFLATQIPDTARAENASAPLRWLSLPEAREATSEPNLKETLSRLAHLLGH